MARILVIDDDEQLRQILVEDRGVDGLHECRYVVIADFDKRNEPPQVVTAPTGSRRTQSVPLIHRAVTQLAAGRIGEVVAQRPIAKAVERWRFARQTPVRVRTNQSIEPIVRRRLSKGTIRAAT